MVSLQFSGVPPALLQDLTNLLNSVPNSLSEQRSVEVQSHPEGLVFCLDNGESGYSFCRNTGAENDVALFRQFLQDPIQSLYMPVAYEIASPSVVPSILANYAGIVGSVANKIDWIIHKVAGKTLLLLRIPREAVATMYAPQGGTLTTRVRGTAGALRQIATLKPIVPEEAGADDEVHRAFAIEYGRDAYVQAMAAHGSVLREVIAKPNLGICIGPLAVWTP